MFKAVIFDFFGVIHSDPAYRWFQKHKIERVGDYAEIFKKVDYGFISQEDAYLELSNLSGVSLEEIKNIFSATDMIDHDVVNIIVKLKSKYKIAMLSNARNQYLKNILDKNDLTDNFDQIIVSSDVGLIKPDHQIFELALNKLDITAEETVFIDDAERNITAAKELGITSLLFENSTKLKNDFEKLGVRID